MFTMSTIMENSKRVLSKDSFQCPKCGEDTYNNYEGHPNPYVGFCRSCGYCMTPEEYEQSQEQIIASYSSTQIYKKLSSTNYEEEPDWMLKKEYFTPALRINILFKYISDKLGLAEVLKTFARYKVETHIRNFGSAIFYRLNAESETRAFKVMSFEKDGHRTKIKDNETKKEYSSVYQRSIETSTEGCNAPSSPDEPKYPLFGRHLLSRPDAENKTICIVESEKTALMAATLYPEFIWMATGSCYFLFDSHLKGLEGRKIVLFPDLDTKYEPLAYIDDESRNPRKPRKRCINWYVINGDNFGLEKNKNITVSRFLDDFVESQKCNNCPLNKKCGSSIHFDTNNAVIKNGEIKFDNIHCPREDKENGKEKFHGYDLGDYISENPHKIDNPNKLIEPLTDKEIKKIKSKVKKIEELRGGGER